ncbi:uncharacterized protein LOC131013931 [Salvia miltiorrhiza]|uniref:uncharacterized protein LOC131013931 n=1 Tax=Salvia miltiorrhiza TaxID=226208 RepID=UPI0025AB69EE|nr:uncharacterized protein LOC131013931 [Salvia miltiorrhiza]
MASTSGAQPAFSPSPSPSPSPQATPPSSPPQDPSVAPLSVEPATPRDSPAASESPPPTPRTPKTIPASRLGFAEMEQMFEKCGAGRESAIPVVDVDDDVPISALVRDIPTPASRQVQQKRKAAVQALAEKRRKKGPSKADRLVDPEVGSAGGAEAASVDAEGSEVPALPAGESGASGSRPISSLKGRDFVRTLLSHIHPKDRETTGKSKRAILANQLSQLALQLESRVGEAIQCIDDYDALEKDLEKEKERTASRDEEVAGMVEQYSKAEADVAELKAKLAQAEVEKASLASELERAKKEGYEIISSDSG